jgi:hypothetical protein
MPPVSIRLHEDDWHFLKKKADEANIGMSTAGAQILRQWISEMRALEEKSVSDAKPLVDENSEAPQAKSGGQND